MSKVTQGSASPAPRTPVATSLKLDRTVDQDISTLNILKQEKTQHMEIDEPTTSIPTVARENEIVTPEKKSLKSPSVVKTSPMDKTSNMERSTPDRWQLSEHGVEPGDYHSASQLATAIKSAKVSPSLTDQKRPIRHKQSRPDDLENSDTWSDDDDYESTEVEVVLNEKDLEKEERIALERVRTIGIEKESWSDDFEFYSYSLGFLISPDAILSAIYGYHKFGEFVLGSGKLPANPYEILIAKQFRRLATPHCWSRLLSLTFGISGCIWPLLICAVFVGCPVMFMELAIGQYTSSSPVYIFRTIAPVASGISWLMLFMNTVVFLNDFTQISMTLALFWDVATNHLKSGMEFNIQAAKCTNPWNDLACRELTPNIRDEYVMKNGWPYTSLQGRLMQARWYVNQLNDDIDQSHTLRQQSPFQAYLVGHIAAANDTGGLRPSFPSEELLMSVFLVILVLFYLDKLSRKAITWFTKFTVLMVFFFVCSVFLCQRIWSTEKLETHPEGNKQLDWTSRDLWMWSIGHLAIVLKIGQGGLCSLGSMNNFRSFILKHVLVLTSLSIYITYGLAALCNPFLENMFLQTAETFEKKSSKRDEFWSAHDKGIISLWADVLFSFFTSKDFGGVYGFCFLLVNIAVFFCHKIIRYRMIIQIIHEYCHEKMSQHMTKQAVMFMSLLIFFCKYLVATRTSAFYTTQAVALLIVAFEIGAILLLYGPRRFLCNLNLMTFGRQLGSRRPVLWQDTFSILHIVICGCLGVTAFACLTVYIMAALEYQQNSPNLLNGIVFPCVMFLVVPGYAAYKGLVAYREGLNLWNLSKPIPILWGPRDEYDRLRTQKEERRLRVS